MRPKSRTVHGTEAGHRPGRGAHQIASVQTSRSARRCSGPWEGNKDLRRNPLLSRTENRVSMCEMIQNMT